MLRQKTEVATRNDVPQIPALPLGAIAGIAGAGAGLGLGLGIGLTKWLSKPTAEVASSEGAPPTTGILEKLTSPAKSVAGAVQQKMDLGHRDLIPEGKQLGEDDSQPFDMNTLTWAEMPLFGQNVKYGYVRSQVERANAYCTDLVVGVHSFEDDLRYDTRLGWGRQAPPCVFFIIGMKNGTWPTHHLGDDVLFLQMNESYNIGGNHSILPYKTWLWYSLAAQKISGRVLPPQCANASQQDGTDSE